MTIRAVLFALAAGLTCSGPAFAARDAASAEAPGWVKPMLAEARDGRISKAESAVFAEKVDGLWRMLLATPELKQPKGFSISREVVVRRPDGPLPDWTPVSAQGDMLLRAVELSGGSKQQADGTWSGVGEGPTIKFTVNDPTALFFNPTSEDTQHGLLMMPVANGERAGFTVLKFSSRDHIVFTRGGKLPYRHTTKAEFLAYQVADLKASVAKFSPGEAPVLEKDLQAKEAELAALAPAEREARACQSGEFKYGTFTPCEMADAYYLVRLEPAYFDRSLPKTAVQLITLSVPQPGRDTDKMLGPVIWRALDQLDLEAVRVMLE